MGAVPGRDAVHGTQRSGVKAGTKGTREQGNKKAGSKGAREQVSKKEASSSQFIARSSSFTVRCKLRRLARDSTGDSARSAQMP
jgi:hypothetical protein